jgi:hypothetical protein
MGMGMTGSFAPPLEQIYAMLVLLELERAGCKHKLLRIINATVSTTIACLRANRETLRRRVSADQLAKLECELEDRLLNTLTAAVTPTRRGRKKTEKVIRAKRFFSVLLLREQGKSYSEIAKILRPLFGNVRPDAYRNSLRRELTGLLEETLLSLGPMSPQRAALVKTNLRKAPVPKLERLFRNLICRTLFPTLLEKKVNSNEQLEALWQWESSPS